MRKTIVAVILIAVFLPIAILFVRSATPLVDMPVPTPVLGQATPVTVHVQDPHGVLRATAFVEQNGAQFPVWELAQPSRATDSTWSFVVGVKSTPQLRDGKATLIVEATSNDLRRKTTRFERDVTVVTQLPTVSVDSEQHYLYLGMADLATFSVSGSWTEAGVRVGDQTFRSWPMPGGKPGMFSLFAFAWNMPADTIPQVFAGSGAGSDVTSPIAFQFPKKEQPKYTVHDLQVSDSFMQKVVNELDPNGSGDPVTRFVKINNDMRRANNKTLSDLRLKTADRFLFSQVFARSLIRRLKQRLPTCGTICITKKRSISRSTSDTISRSRST